MPTTRRSARMPEERGQRVSMNRDVVQALRFARAIRNLYWTLATMSGLLLLAVMGGGFGIVTVVSAVVFAVMVAGALQIERHPVAWSLLMAGMLTLRWVAGAILRASNDLPVFGLADDVALVIVFARWGAVALAVGL